MEKNKSFESAVRNLYDTLKAYLNYQRIVDTMLLPWKPQDFFGNGIVYLVQYDPSGSFQYLDLDLENKIIRINKSLLEIDRDMALYMLTWIFLQPYAANALETDKLVFKVFEKCRHRYINPHAFKAQFIELLLSNVLNSAQNAERANFMQSAFRIYDKENGAGE